MVVMEETRRMLKHLLSAPLMTLLIAVFAPVASIAAPPPAEFRNLLRDGLSAWQGFTADAPVRARMSDAERSAAQPAADERMRAHWTVNDDGVLHFDGGGDSLVSKDTFRNFELHLEWKVEPGGDSGIYLRGMPQVQIWANDGGSGGLYNNATHPRLPLVIADKPVGEWNAFRIFMIGDRVTVYLNDRLVVDQTVLENLWNRAAGIPDRGAIELQAHGTPLWFRNIHVRELPDDASPKQPVLEKRDRIAIIGDSITEQKLYSLMMETYLHACMPEWDLRIMQFGWSGEVAPGFNDRLVNDVLPFQPDIVTTCYGMNDGSYRPYDETIGARYRDAMQWMVEGFRLDDITVVVGSPGAVDTHTFRRNDLSPAVYNDNLAHLRDIARELAAEYGQPFANVHDTMINAMERAKASLGEAYHVCGADGFHPWSNGHLLMAEAFLHALEIDGAIGTITVDLAQNTATATDGHRVQSVENGRVSITSTRYPFCFFGSESDPAGTRSMAPFTNFNDRFNRFTLKVSGLDGAAADVTWGDQTKRFTAPQLERGVNLAVEFIESNPFHPAFFELARRTGTKQQFETVMIKEVVTRFRGRTDQAANEVKDALFDRAETMHEQVRAALVPVEHTIVITPVSK